MEVALLKRPEEYGRPLTIEELAAAHGMDVETYESYWVKQRKLSRSLDEIDDAVRELEEKYGD